jgi:hypothetical protein
MWSMNSVNPTHSKVRVRCISVIQDYFKNEPCTKHPTNARKKNKRTRVLPPAPLPPLPSSHSHQDKRRLQEEHARRMAMLNTYPLPVTSEIEYSPRESDDENDPALCVFTMTQEE